MDKTLYVNASIIGQTDILEDMAFFVENGRFTEIGTTTRLMEKQNDSKIIDLGGMLVAPGYIDMHIHGMKGKLAEGNRQELEDLSNILPEFGVTSYLPSLTPQKDDYAMLKDLAKHKKSGAEVLGFFLEGHYLHLTGSIKDITRDYSNERIKKLKDSAHPYSIVFAVSPEIKELEQLLPQMTSDGFPAFITHTEATGEETEKAILGGASHATHFYDVFPYKGDVEPGVRSFGAVEAFLGSPNATVDFILDGEHVNPSIVKMVIKSMGINKVSLITDANINAGLGPGAYVGLGGTEIVVEYTGGPARMSENAHTPGGLIGSGLTLDLAVRNAVKMLSLSIPHAVMMASLNPARVLGIDDRKGRIETGYDADFSVMNKDLHVKECYVGGKKAF